MERSKECWWSFDDVQDRLIEAMTVFSWGLRRGQRWATDGPWRQMRPDWSDLYAPHTDEADLAHAVALKVLKGPPPERAMIGRAEATGAWLSFLSEADRRAVVAAVIQLAAGAARVDWMEAKLRAGVVYGADGVRMRYQRAVGKLAKALNAGKLIA
jgi:hypothetical protein